MREPCRDCRLCPGVVKARIIGLSPHYPHFAHRWLCLPCLYARREWSPLRVVIP